MKFDIAKTADHARIGLTPEEMQQFEKEINSMLEMLGDLPETDERYTNVNPDNPMYLREDVVTENTNRDVILENSAAVKNGYVVVPKTVE